MWIIKLIWSRISNKILNVKKCIDIFFRKLIFILQYILIYFFILFFLLLLVIPVLNILPIIMAIIIILGALVAYFYNSKRLSLTLISLWCAFIFSSIIYHFLYNGFDYDFIIELVVLTYCLFFPIGSYMMISCK